LKRIILYSLFLIVIIHQSCCFGAEESGIDMVPRVSITNAIKMKSNFDTIYKIAYPNTTTQLTPNSNISKLLLSNSYEFTTLYILSTKGYDTITIQTPIELSYESNKCDPDFVAKKNFSPILVNYTFDTCFFKRYWGKYSQREIFDTLIVN